MDLSKLPKFSQTKPGDAPQPVMDTSAPPPDPNRPTVAIYATPEFRETRSRRSADDILDRGDFLIQIWLSAIFGIIFILMGLDFGKFLLAKMHGQTYMTTATWQTGPKAGEPVAYVEFIKYTHPTIPGRTMEAWWDDSAYFIFGLALLFEALSLLAIRARFGFSIPLLGLALLIAFVATTFNLIVAIKLFGFGTLPLMSLIAVAFGGWLVASEWQILTALLAQKVAPNAGKTFGAQGG